MKFGLYSQAVIEMMLSRYLYFSHNSQRTGSSYVPSESSYLHNSSCNASCQFCSVAARFPYLMERKPEDGDEDARAVQLDWKIIEGAVDNPFVSSGLEFVPLPVRTGAVKCCSDLVMFCLLN